MFNFSVGDKVIVNGRESGHKFENSFGEIVIIRKEIKNAYLGGYGILFDEDREWFHTLTTNKEYIEDYTLNLMEEAPDSFFNRGAVRLLPHLGRRGFWIYSKTIEKGFAKIEHCSNPYDPSQQPVDDEDI